MDQGRRFGCCAVLAYNFVSGIVQETVEPYLLEEEAQTETEAPAEEADADIVKSLVGRVESVFGIRLDYENFIFEFANDYAQTMMEQSEAEHNSAELADKCRTVLQSFFH